MEQLRRKDEGAPEALVAAYGDRVYRLALRITGNRSDAEEVVQDALWSAIRKIDTFRGTAAFGSWVYRITANAAYQKRRPRRIERNGRSWEEVSPSFDETGEQVQPGIDWAPRLKDPVLQAELQSVLSAAIDELPAEHRAIFILRDVEGLSHPEIAEAVQIDLSTIKSRVHRARLFLRSRLAVYMGSGPELSPGRRGPAVHRKNPRVTRLFRENPSLAALQSEASGSPPARESRATTGTTAPENTAEREIGPAAAATAWAIVIGAWIGRLAHAA
jgi:RNA polymerase sigma-70 factor (ECF subfamily)